MGGGGYISVHMNRGLAFKPARSSLLMTSLKMKLLVFVRLLSLSFVLDFAVFVLDILAQTVQESHIQSLLVFAHVVPEGGVGGFARLWSL